MKQLFLILFLACNFVAYAGPIIKTDKFRWCNDDGNETSATWKAAINTPVTLTSRNQNIRLRLNFFNSPGSGLGWSFDHNKFYYSKNGGAKVPVTNDASKDFIFSSSSFVTNGDTTTNQFPPNYPFKKGYFDSEVISSSNQNYTLGIPESTSTEVEYCIRATAAATDLATYIFYADTANTVYYNANQPASLTTQFCTPTSSTETISACNSYTWHDTLYTESNNTATWTGTNASGCDSVVTLNLTIGQSNTGDITAFACNSFDWYGTTYTASATPSRTFTNVSGCDSVVTLHLTIGNSNTGDTTATACNSFDWYGTSYTSSDEPTHTFTNVTGCDSVVTLHLTIGNANTGDTTAFVCNSFDWYGTTYTITSNPTHTFTNVSGCDSVVTLHLTIDANTGDTTASACNSFVWYGTTYTSTSNPTHTFTNVSGCDSVVTLHLTITTQFTTGGINYVFTSPTTVAVGANYESTGVIVIPNSVTTTCGTYAVTSINNQAFSNSGITEVTIPNSLASIGTKAFEECYSLISVTIPNSVNSIGDEAFRSCTGLTSVTIPNSVTIIGIYAFGDCSGLTSITIGNSVTSISEGAFYFCSALTSVSIPNSVTSIGASAFQNCFALNSITIPNSVTGIGYRAFSRCSGLSSINIGNSVTFIDDQAFRSCTNLTSIICNVSTPVTIAANVFQSVTQGACRLAVPNASVVAYRAANVWKNFAPIICVNPSFDTTTISACGSYTWSVNSQTYTTSGTRTWRGTNASGCDSVVTLHLTIGNSNTGDTTVFACNSFDWYGTTYTASATPTRTFTNVSGCDSVVTLHLTIGNSNTGDTAASACNSFDWYGTTYTVSATPTYTFTNVSGCDSVVTLNLTIGNSNTGDTTAFACNSFVWYGTTYTASATPTLTFTNVSGCDSVVTLHLTINSNTGDTTASACNSFVWYGTTYTSTSNPTYTFTNVSGCDSVVTLHLIITTQPTNFTSGGINYVVTSPTTVAVGFNSSATGVVVIPDSVTTACGIYAVTSINEGAFFNRTGLTSVTIPNSVTSMGNIVFQGCTGLTSITIGNSLTSLGFGAFASCSRLTSVILPNSVTNIGIYAFTGCSGLTSVTLPNAITSLSDGIFNGCSQLTSITIPNSVTSIGSQVFQNCTRLTSITIPNTVTSLGQSVFQNCSGLTSVSISNSVPSIGNQCFQFCTSLTSATIPNSVTSIGQNAFQGCSSLSLVSLSNTLTSIGSGAFNSCVVLSNVTIPNTLTSIGSFAFVSCSRLTSVNIGNSVNSIAASAFAGCTGLTSVICNVSTPVTIAANVFQNVNQAVCSLTVPNASIVAYRAASVWKNFAPIICANPTVDTITISACGSYTWSSNSQTYTTSGSYTSLSGCVTSILNLTIKQPTTSTQSIVACTNYTWNGVTYTTSGTKTWTGTNAVGCDSVASLILTISTRFVNPPFGVTQNVISNLCSSRVYKYTASASPVGTTYNWILPTSIGGVSGVILDSGDINSSRTLLVRYASNEAAFATDSIKVRSVNVCSSKYTAVKLSINKLSVPIPASITVTSIDANACSNRKYRFTAPSLPTGINGSNSTFLPATGYLWSLLGSLSEFATIDSGDENSQKIVVIFSTNTAAIIGDSIKLQYLSSCGNSIPKALKLSNTKLSAPIPSTITIAALQTNVCGARKYRYTAPNLPVSTSNYGAATGYVWSLVGLLSGTATIDSGDVNSQKIVVTFTSNAAAATGDSIRLYYTSDCGNGARKASKLTNTLLSAPSAPYSISIQIKSDVCNARKYRYIAPAVLPSATSTTGAATGYLWSAPTGAVGSTGTIDSGDVNSRIITVTYTSNAAATTGDSIRLLYTSLCGDGKTKALRLSNKVKNGCAPIAKNVSTSRVPTTVSSPMEVNVYPNPTTSQFNIQIKSSSTEAATVRVLDFTGRFIKAVKVSSNTNVNIGLDLKAGAYMLEVRQGKEVKMVRVVKF